VSRSIRRAPASTTWASRLTLEPSLTSGNGISRS
jgi:hypothetical protein